MIDKVFTVEQEKESEGVVSTEIIPPVTLIVDTMIISFEPE